VRLALALCDHYETLLVCLTGRFSYLAFLCKWSRRLGVKEFWTAFRRCLLSFPTEAQLPFSSAVEKQRWTDYTFHNSLVDYVCAHLSEDAGVFLEKCLRLMPRNAGLLKRYGLNYAHSGQYHVLCILCPATSSRFAVCANRSLRLHIYLVTSLSGLLL